MHEKRIPSPLKREASALRRSVVVSSHAIEVTARSGGPLLTGSVGLVLVLDINHAPLVCGERRWRRG